MLTTRSRRCFSFVCSVDLKNADLVDVKPELFSMFHDLYLTEEFVHGDRQKILTLKRKLTFPTFYGGKLMTKFLRWSTMLIKTMCFWSSTS